MHAMATGATGAVPADPAVPGGPADSAVPGASVVSAGPAGPASPAGPVTTPSGQRLESIALAVLVELPLACVCLWVGYHTHQLAERRIVLLLRRPPRR